MANISKKIMPQANMIHPAIGCPFLDKLPVELRLTIYEMLFEGSQARVTLAKTADSSTQSTTVILRYSKHLNLLLSCRAICNEALATYWSKTVLRLECPPVQFRRPSEFRPAKFKLDTYAHRLCASLPQSVKANVRHIRGMVLPSLTSEFVEANPRLTASALLASFKKLSTCEMSPSLAHPVDGIVSHTKDPKNNGFSTFKMTLGQEPTRWLADQYGIDATAGVAFLFKGNIMFSMETDEFSMSASLKKSLVCWHPHDIICGRSLR